MISRHVATIIYCQELCIRYSRGNYFIKRPFDTKDDNYVQIGNQTMIDSVVINVKVSQM